jgi:DNA-binding NarL/FixJ family response regulator
MIDTATTTTSIFLAIPDASILASVKSVLPESYKETIFKDLTALVEAAATVNPQLILCHQSLFESTETMTLGQMTLACPSSRVMVIGPPRPVSIQIDALKHGARGYFNEALPLDKLNEALQLILHGEVWVERYVISGLIDELTHTPSISDEQKQALDSLSPKELEVSKLVSHGATNKLIAKQLNITERTVKAHLTAIFHKMGLKDRLALAIFFRDLR